MVYTKDNFEFFEEAKKITKMYIYGQISFSELSMRLNLLGVDAEMDTLVIL